MSTMTKQLFSRPLTRRALLQHTLVSPVLVNLLSATQPAVAAPDLLASIAREGKKLFVYNWEDYIHPSVIPQFEKEFAVKVTYDTYPSNEHLLAKLQAGGARYDVIFPTHNFVPVYLGQNLLLPLNHAHLPNLEHLFARFRSTSIDPGNQFTVPYGWGTTALAYNRKYTSEEAHLGSWRLLFDSGPQRYRGKIGLTDEREEVIAAALQYLGYTPNSRDVAELRQAGEVLMRLRPHVKAFYPGVEAKKALITEDIVVALSWSGETVKAQAHNAAITWSLPQEGGTGWFDCMAIPRAARHPVTAHAFLNFMLRPEVAAANANTTGYATANRVAKEQHVAPQVAQNPAIYPAEEVMQRITFLEVIPDNLLPVYEDIWLRLLAG